MARGMVVGEAIQSQAATEEFREGYARTFGDRKPQRGRWVYDERQGKCVPADEYVSPSRALDAPIMVDRFMEGAKAPDGTDIGNRTRRRAWMKASGAADFDDFKGTREARRKELEAKARGEVKPDKHLREIIGRELYKQKVIL